MLLDDRATIAGYDEEISRKGRRVLEPNWWHVVTRPDRDSTNHMLGGQPIINRSLSIIGIAYLIEF